MTLLRSIRLTAIFYGGLVLWTAVYIPSMAFLWLWFAAVRGFPWRKAVRRCIKLYGIVCCALLRSQTPVQTESPAAPMPSPCIVAANHQSFFDAYCLGFFGMDNHVFAVRAWPFKIPFYGPVMRWAGYLNTEALDTDQFLAKARKLLDENVTLVFFPEGTRSATGKMARFRSGAFKLAMLYNVPVIPLCVNGTGNVFPRGKFLGRPAPVRLTLLPPVYPADFAQYGDLAHLRLQRHVKAVILKELKEHPLHPTLGEEE